MSDVSIQLVREFFELNAFHVMTFWQHESARPRSAEHGLQLYVENTALEVERDIEYVLRPGDVASIPRALVEVRAWHADRFYASVIEGNPVLLQVADADSRARAGQVFGGAPFDTILVISELPPSPDSRERAVRLLHDAGVGHVLEFPTLLHEMIEKISGAVSYAPSQTLQTLRLLKRYRFIRRQQLELPFPTEAAVSATPPVVETAPPAPADEADESE